MSDEPTTTPEPSAHDEPKTPEGTSAHDEPRTHDEDVAEANRRRMREALEHKRGVNHPDDRAAGGTGVRGTLPPAAGRDFTRRKSG